MDPTSTPVTLYNDNSTSNPTIFPRSGYNILAFVMFLNAVFSIFNNTLVILVTLKYPQLRNPMNIFILNMSFSDLMMTLCGTTVVVSTNYHGYFYLGENFCTFQGFAVNYFGIVSLWSLTVLAYERYNVVCQPIGALKLSTIRGYRGLAFIWLFCLIWAIAPLFGWSSYAPEGVQTSCSIGWEVRSWNNYSYSITLFITSFIIPVGIIGMSYGSIILSLYKLNRKIEEQGGKTNREEEIRVAVMVLLMVVAFLVCWLPYTIFAMIVVINPTLYISPLLATLPTYFAKTSPIYNPIIYIFLNKEFRNCAVMFLTCGHISLSTPEEETASVEIQIISKQNQVAPAE
ncbi:vertebrate ancient opsin-like [Pelobates cultripes]|uniref:Vertebrate ancient opsin-like n=1 Tax=Pelobates cultripes TaxID=61616 RepID=A0AAD1W1Q1_PELCU|nr:vertebrate ancient opsin-like [Pelobates cultripes]